MWLLLQLQMFGNDISWSAFQAVECMSFASFRAKRVGYLAASLSFSPTTDVILLTTNLFKKVRVTVNICRMKT